MESFKHDFPSPFVSEIKRGDHVRELFNNTTEKHKALIDNILPLSSVPNSTVLPSNLFSPAQTSPNSEETTTAFFIPYRYLIFLLILPCSEEAIYHTEIEEKLKLIDYYVVCFNLI
jgi:hypothetical protein